MVYVALRIRIDRYALSCISGVGECESLITELIRITKDRACSTRRTGLRNTALGKFISLRGVASADASGNHDRRARRASSRRRRRRTPADRPVNPPNLIRHAGINTAGGTSLAPSRARSSEASTRVLPGRGTVGLHSAIRPTPLTPNRKGHVGLDLDPIRTRAQNCRRAQGDREGGSHLGDRLV